MNIIIVLGKKLLDDGKMDDILIQRLLKCKEMFEKNDDSKIIVSGGKVQKNSIHTEAYEMKKYLVNKCNIPSEKIIKECHSKDTIDNSKKCLKIINKMDNIKKILVISSDFHIKRVKTIFNHYFKSYKNLSYISSRNFINGEILKEKIRNEEKYLDEFKFKFF